LECEDLLHDVDLLIEKFISSFYYNNCLLTMVHNFLVKTFSISHAFVNIHCFVIFFKLGIHHINHRGF